MKSRHGQCERASSKRAARALSEPPTCEQSPPQHRSVEVPPPHSLSLTILSLQPSMPLLSLPCLLIFPPSSPLLSLPHTFPLCYPLPSLTPHLTSPSAPLPPPSPHLPALLRPPSLTSDLTSCGIGTASRLSFASVASERTRSVLPASSTAHSKVVGGFNQFRTVSGGIALFQAVAPVPGGP